MENALPAAPIKPLLALGAAVLVTHLLLLQAAPMRLKHHEPPLPRPLITRTLAPASAPLARQPVSRPLPATPPAALPSAQTQPVPAELITAATPTPESPNPEPLPPPASVAPEPAPTHAVPGSARLKYDISGTLRGLDYHARGELLWRHDGSSYEARLEVGAFLLGSRVQTSRGQVTAQGLEPKRFSDKVRSEVAAHFEREKGKIIFSANTPEVVLQAGAQDHLSVFVQLAGLLAGSPGRYPPGSAIELQAVGPRDAALWRFTVDGPEQLHLPGGEQATLKLTRAPAHPYDLKAELWLAPALDWLPARIRLTQDNGDFIDQQWRTSEAP